jgi:DeoR/GlpR family transcriptional regulator of sugar metabolism
VKRSPSVSQVALVKNSNKGHTNGQISQGHKNGRAGSIVSILKSKGPSRIKDISMLMREVSEKTIQRELQLLIQKGQVEKSGERRWTIYTYIGTGSENDATEEAMLHIDQKPYLG